jgi:ATP synthase protein I
MGDDLNERIARAREKIELRQRPRLASPGRGAGLGFRMASDFVAATVVGAGLGWGVDALFHVSPWGLIVGLLLGFVAGVRKIVRDASAAQTTPAEPGPDDAAASPASPTGPPDPPGER